MACSAPNRFAERYPDRYGGLELPPLVARRFAVDFEAFGYDIADCYGRPPTTASGPARPRRSY